MKKVLYTGTALVAITAITFPIAALEIDFSGRVRFNAVVADKFQGHDAADVAVTTGVTNYYTPQPASAGASFSPAGAAVSLSRLKDGDIMFSNDERLDVKVSASTCCFTYGGMMRIEDAGIRSDIYLANDEWGRLDLGDLDNARAGAYDVSVFAAGPLYADLSVTAGSLETDLVFDSTQVGSSRSNPIAKYSSPTFSGISMEIATNGDQTEGGLKIDMAPYGVPGLGLRGSLDSQDRYGVMGTYEFGDYNFAAFGGEDDDGDYYSGGTVSYDIGAFAASLSFARARGRSTTEVTENDFIGGVKYKVAPGLTASASVKNENNQYLGSRNSGHARLQLQF